MALLALVEWFLAIRAVDVAYRLFLVLSFFHLDLPPIIGLVVLACPGNGFAAYCTPLGLFAFAVSAGAVVTAVLVNFSRKRRLDREGLDGGATRVRLETNLTLYASLALIVVYAESSVFLISGQAFLGTEIHTIAAQVISPLLILVFVFTGRHLLRPLRPSQRRPPR